MVGIVCYFAEVAQLVRASPCQGEGRGFESLFLLCKQRLQYFMYNIDIITNKVIYLPLELNEATKTIGNFDNLKKLVNSKYYSATLNYTYNTFLVTT